MGKKGRCQTGGRWWVPLARWETCTPCHYRKTHGCQISLGHSSGAFKAAEFLRPSYCILHLENLVKTLCSDALLRNKWPWSHGKNLHPKKHPWRTLGSGIYRDKTYEFWLSVLISFQHLLWLGGGLSYLSRDSLSGHQELLQEIISRLLLSLGSESDKTFTAIALQNQAKVLNYWFETTLCL